MKFVFHLLYYNYTLINDRFLRILSRDNDLERTKKKKKKDIFLKIKEEENVA